MKDFLGNEFTVGDIIVYPKTSGRSVALVKATVLKFNESGSVSVQPELESWQGGRPRGVTTHYVDTRTGKRFPPYSTRSEQHKQRPSGYEHKVTGEWLSTAEWGEAEDQARRSGRLSWQEIHERRQQWTWTPVIWKPYVAEESVIQPVTLTRTDNIVRVSPSVPAEQT